MLPFAAAVLEQYYGMVGERIAGAGVLQEHCSAGCCCQMVSSPSQLAVGWLKHRSFCVEPVVGRVDHQRQVGVGPLGWRSDRQGLGIASCRVESV